MRAPQVRRGIHIPPQLFGPNIGEEVPSLPPSVASGSNCLDRFASGGVEFIENAHPRSVVLFIPALLKRREGQKVVIGLGIVDSHVAREGFEALWPDLEEENFISRVGVIPGS
jgi:hypothetical protein